MKNIKFKKIFFQLALSILPVLFFIHLVLASSKQLTIFYAAGLNASMNSMIKEFKKINPATEIIGESSGTFLAIRKITELNKPADILLAADAFSIQTMLMPKFADWYITFYKDRVVLAYTDRSKYTNEINAQNWFKILLRKDVQFGIAN
ncbi:MAG: substrate-binding domain-containing protein, partial [Candidatus Omnitrophica bacterium]|nr:substrate-binding domain-containing protein [Candidatus Omnitrophota bacterium]